MQRTLAAIALSLAFASTALAFGPESTDLAFEPAKLPNGWTAIEEGGERPPAEAAIAKAVEAAAKDANVAVAETKTLSQSVRLAGGKTATFSLVDVFVEPGDLPKALQAKAKENGWAYREMAGPAHLLVVEGPKDQLEALVAAQVRASGVRLGDKARTIHDRDEAEAFAKAALALVPTHGGAHFVLGIVALPPRPSGGDGDLEKSLPEFRLAVGDKADPPLIPSEKGVLGDLLLSFKGPADLARDMLKAAVEANLEEGIDRQRRMGWRYNLACAYGRLKELDPAFSHLEAVLKEDESQRVGGIEHWRKDPDFDALHDDPRWKPLTEKYPVREPEPREEK